MPRHLSVLTVPFWVGEELLVLIALPLASARASCGSAADAVHFCRPVWGHVTSQALQRCQACLVVEQQYSLELQYVSQKLQPKSWHGEAQLDHARQPSHRCLACVLETSLGTRHEALRVLAT